MNLSNEVEVDRYSENPEALILLVESVLNKLHGSINNSEYGHKQAQLIEVSKSINRLAKLSIPIPDGLRSLKLNLLAEIEVTSAHREDLTNIVGGISSIIDRIESGYLSKPSKLMHARNKTRKSTLPQTKQAVFNAEIIDALKILGGSGSAREVKDIIEERMKDKFLPGDLQMHTSSNMLVWKTLVHRGRLRLKTKGILRSDSQTGTWELSEGYQ